MQSRDSLSRRQYLVIVSLSAWALSLLVAAMFFPGKVAALMLFASTYVVAAASGLAFRDRRLQVTLLAIVALHHGMSVVDVYMLSPTGNTISGDAADFHAAAASMAGSMESQQDQPAADRLSLEGLNSYLGSESYRWFLTRLYLLWGSHPLVGAAAGTMAFLAFSILLYRIGLMLGIGPRHAAHATLVVGMLPSTVVVTSITLREPWKLLFLALSVYSTLQYFETLRIRFWLITGVAVAALVLLHEGFGVLGPLLLMVPFAFLLWAVRQGGYAIPHRGLLVVMVPLMLAVAVSFYILHNADYSTAAIVRSENVLAELGAFNSSTARRAEESRAYYAVSTRTDTAADFALSVPLLYVYFMAAPFPWQIRTYQDVYGLIDVWIGLLFLWGSLREMRRVADPQGKLQRRYLLGVFVVVSLAHSLGTFNYGTAARHRLMTSWICILLGWEATVAHMERRLSSLRPRAS